LENKNAVVNPFFRSLLERRAGRSDRGPARGPITRHLHL